MRIVDLGEIPYRDAWKMQEALMEEVAVGGQERALLLEHPPVITFGRRPGLEKNILTPADRLAEMGVEVVPSDRGGDVTFHGPGQLVVYPILRLKHHGLSVGGYVCRLQQMVVEMLGGGSDGATERRSDEGGGTRKCDPASRHSPLATTSIHGILDKSAIGVWAEDPQRGLAKICALGVRIRRGVTMHGIALNVTTDLRYFDLINPCGLGRPVTSMQRLLGERTPTMRQVKEQMGRSVEQWFREAGPNLISKGEI